MPDAVNDRPPRKGPIARTSCLKQWIAFVLSCLALPLPGGCLRRALFGLFFDVALALLREGEGGE